MDNFQLMGSVIKEEIEKDVQQYIQSKYGSICDFKSNSSYRIDEIRPSSGDWVALYLNGKLIAEGHSLTPHDVFDAISNVFSNEYHYNEISDEKAEEGFSQNLEDMLSEYRFDLMKGQ